MEPVEYDETIHPVVWLNKIKSCCFKNQITKKEDIMEFCKSMVHPSIDVSKAKQRKLIRFGSCITLKHVATGKYLTSCNVRYKTGSLRKIVFASQTLSNPNSLWIVSDYDQKNESNPIIYGKSKVYFLNKGVNENIVISKTYKSPSTGNWEVSCILSRHMHLIESDSTNNDDSTYIKSKEIINIRDGDVKFILRSNEFLFTIDNETYQEVVGHEGRVDGNDKWCIELFENE
ncbi:unnamed protein product [Rhizophagus irregularis]|uniref:MIR domain-containing protein n=1 Tax=Rhizophagus irregularis TaxID=588596 RepID=A0A915YZX4_9GLOM|nr:unnamed protein product [Rhizophagus irregularis]CAB5356074.1 unnamed protein product [Rhizophagus irregularis]